MSELASNKDYFTGLMFKRQFAPALISAIGLSFADMADAIVVGQSMGVNGLAAISLALPIFMIVNVIMHGFGLGGAVKFSDYLSKGEKQKAVNSFQSVISTAVFIGIGLAILFNLFLKQVLFVLGTSPEDGELYEITARYSTIIIWAIPVFFISYIFNYYLRNDDSEKLASFGFTVGNLSDLALNIILVLILDLGVTGAALSTVIGQLITISIYLIGLKIKKEHNLKFKNFKLSFANAAASFKLGFSSSFQYICTFFFVLFANNALMNLMGSSGVAVFDIIQNTAFLVIYMYEAISKSAQPIMSTYHGEKNAMGMKNIHRLSMIVCAIVGVVISVLVFAFPNVICMLFGIDDVATQEIAFYALRVYAVSICFIGFNILFVSFAQCSQDSKSAFIISTLRSVAILFPVSIICYLISANFVWWLYPITEALSLAIYLIYKKVQNKKIAYSERVYSKIITNKNTEISLMVEEINDFCDTWGASIKQSYFVAMTVEEICESIINNGFKDGKGYIQVTVVAQENSDYTLCVRDSAVSFNPFSLQTNKVGTDEDYDMDAMGILVIKKKAKEFFYRRYQGFNTLVVTI